MGIVFKQTFSNTIVTFVGFGIGAINTLFLYTNFLTKENYGLVTVILATAALLMPLLTFGVQNTLVKFYSSYKDSDDVKYFLNLMLYLPLLTIIPFTLFSYFGTDFIGDFLAEKNEEVKGYVWYIYFVGLAMSYFEIFYSWVKVHMKSVFGNFMKEVFGRLCIAILLVLVHYNVITVDLFLKSLVGVYVLRMVVMKLYAFSLEIPSLKFRLPKNYSSIIKYSALIILGGSAAVILLEIDKFMLNQYLAIENVAFYGVSVFIATVITVPSRAMHQITHPLTAKLLNSKDKPELRKLYKKSSLTLFIISGIIFLLIILNLQELYKLMPVAYRGGMLVVFLIGLTKVLDALLGNSNSILFNSDYYRAILVMGVLLAIVVVLLNYMLIPAYGLGGAAWATFIAIASFNTVKIGYVYAKFKMHPFTLDTLKVLLLLCLLGGVFFFINFNFHPILNIAIKSIFIGVVYIFVLYKLRVSEDVYSIVSSYLSKKETKK
ncbi:oligosaccharide flippase family protein [Cellulophaga lytica]|uniref:Polysaccharide biosynthesis protein n=1 Tax=Cellulophaga geojensis KL-A TaxID=1328323 RepID=A0ABN0RPU3_9FLAO|nr:MULTISPECIES: oligosaccharide flippase family protein [Cellulophaga]APU11426.1 sugar isomerase [Cellulophaga lytica]EWH13934.1 polysaccharide biosynthesis protein [Cellulophaga geojensis KL-A]TVZ10144.1 O-antigen/teichoic acid export membrane protein [Cellulophaga sp. RHA_52]SNQ44483.1 Polysaccharide biosynthesis protein [Cellulophaga lytica]